MGTSSTYSGPGSRTQLVPTWLGPDNTTPQTAGGGAVPGDDSQGDGAQTAPNQMPRSPLLNQPPPNFNRFATARTNLSRFARSGGKDRASLGRAISHYVSTSSGGAQQAARRMGASRTTGGRLLNFLSDAVARGAREALRTLNLESLVGQPIEDVFLGLADYVCPDGGTVDEGIARDAFIETIADLAENGITNLDALTADQMQTVFELYATHAIEDRLCNDVGTKVIVLPSNARAAERIQAQLRDFIRRGVSDTLTAARDAMQALTPSNVLGFVDRVYQQAFAILQSLGQAEAET